MPFGDQGFCLRREIWERLGGFDTHASYGEDHLFVWKARRAGVPLRPTGGTLRTSARKYQERGWLRTTARHLHLTATQAFPEWLKLVRAR
jgi:GT2 family glycosyltransferase